MDRIKVLLEALPYIKEFRNSFIVIKVGGKPLLDERLKNALMEDISLLSMINAKPILVHGGGPEISEYMRRMGKEPKFVHGLRITDEETLEVVEMVLTGKVNKDLVTRLNNMGCKAVGISGKDGKLIIARKIPPRKLEGSELTIDLGLVGEIESVNPEIIYLLTDNGYIPVISPLGIDPRSGIGLNINADVVAGEIAGAIGAKKLVMITDVPGILRDPSDESSLIRTLSIEEAKRLLEEGIVKGGMIPKLEACIRAIERGVERAHIIDGRMEHSLLLELFTDEGVGTMIHR